MKLEKDYEEFIGLLNSHKVEYLIIGAYAMGASHGVIYVRAEYPLAVKTLNIAIQQARDFGLLGENIMGSGFAFDLEDKTLELFN